MGGGGRVRRQRDQLSLHGCPQGNALCPANDVGHTRFGSICVDLLTNLENCGKCGTDCSTLDGGVGRYTCIAGKCVDPRELPPSTVQMKEEQTRKQRKDAGTISADLPNVKQRRVKKDKKARRRAPDGHKAM